MVTLTVAFVVLLWFYLAYRFYGNFIQNKLVEPDDTRPTPAVEFEDGVDYSPAKRMFLWGHHFASIAGAGPIIGPIIAVSIYGWALPTLWITLGCVFIGGVHDYMSLMLSVRNKGKGIAEIAGMGVGGSTRIVFALLLWITLIFIITVFAESAAHALIKKPQLVIPTFGICVLAMFMGPCVYKLNLNSKIVSIIAVIVSYYLVWLGFKYPLSLPEYWSLPFKENVFTIILFSYCTLASLLPVWLLLQPRDFISSMHLFIGLGLGFTGLVVVHPEISAPAFTGGFVSQNNPVWPMLFITVACGAVSGFHTMVATGTTSKQLAKETHGKIVGYGGMIMEGVLAFLVVLVVGAGLKWGMAPEGMPKAAAEATYFGNAMKESWIVAFGNGFGNLAGRIFPGLGVTIAALLGATMVKTFVMTSLDTSTRLGRFIFCETLAPNSKLINNKIFGTAVVVIPSFLLAISNDYKTIWKMFGASNQLIAAIALVTISAYLVSRKKPGRYTFIPAVFMTLTTIGALLWGMFNPETGYLMTEPANYTLGVIAVLLAAMAVFIFAKSVAALRGYEKQMPDISS
ncbi:MAG: carbon starvation CstA family protein [Thermodesulfobacteriota bacterium]